jgi:hypothetical protein
MGANEKGDEGWENNRSGRSGEEIKPETNKYAPLLRF